MKKLSLSILSITAISLSCVTLVLRIISTLAFFDANGYYTKGAPIPIAANVLTLLSLILFVAAAIFCVKPEEKIDEPNKIAGFGAIFPFGALVFFIAQSLSELPQNMITDEQKIDFIPVIATVAALVGAVFFLLIFYKIKQKLVTVYCGLGAIVFVFFAWMSAYFDFSSTINSAQRTLFYVSCAGAMLFIFNEICAIYGSVKPKFYYFSIFTALLTTAPSAISAIIGSASGKINGYATLKEDVFFSALFIYATVRLITIFTSQKSVDVSKETIEVTMDSAEQTEENTEITEESTASEE